MPSRRRSAVTGRFVASAKKTARRASQAASRSRRRASTAVRRASAAARRSIRKMYAGEGVGACYEGTKRVIKSKGSCKPPFTWKP